MTDDNDKPRGPRPPRTGGAGRGGFTKHGESRGSGNSAPRDRAPGREGGFAPRPRQAEAKADFTDLPGERIAKRLARAGISSRRDAELLIADGRVSVNGKVLATPAALVTHNDIIHVDGQQLPAIERTRLWLFHKPSGLVTTAKDPEGRPTVFDALPEGLPRVVSVGRLDINTEGLLLLTNDGGLARMLELPATGWMRRYRVRAFGKVTQEQLATLKDGVTVDGVFYGAVDALLEREQGSNVWLTIGLREGKNREVKNILGSLGLNVNRLIRISFGPFQLGDLPEGAVLEVKGRTLRDQLGDKLIEESGANFDAPVINEFSNRPVTGSLGREQRDMDDKPLRPPHRRHGEWVGGSDNPIVKRQRKPMIAKSDADKPARKSRGANVWHAPGARPLSPARAEAKETEAEAVPRRTTRSFEPRGDKPYAKKPFGDRPSRDGDSYRERKPRDAAAGETGERPKRDFKPRGDKPYAPKPFGDRPKRDGDSYRERKPRDAAAGETGERPKRDFKPRGDKPYAPKPFGDRPKRDGDSYRERKPREASAGETGDRPKRAYAPRGDKPHAPKPFGDRPARDGDSYRERKPREASAGETGDRPKRAYAPRGDKPYASKPFGDRPGRGGESGGFKPRTERADGDGAKSSRPFVKRDGAKPSGDKPRGGGKPGGFGKGRPGNADRRR